MWWLLAIPVMGAIWLSLRFWLRVRLDNQRRATITTIRSSDYWEADITYEDPPD